MSSLLAERTAYLFFTQRLYQVRYNTFLRYDFPEAQKKMKTKSCSLGWNEIVH